MCVFLVWEIVLMQKKTIKFPIIAFGVVTFFQPGQGVSDCQHATDYSHEDVFEVG
jgi:hypothetical protein